MALAAAQVIDALAARLVPLTASAGRVYTSRAWPLVEVPAWRVTAEDEQVQQATLEPWNQHELFVNATAFARAVADLDDTLHALAAGGLALLFAAPVPYDMRLTGISRQLSTEGEAAIGLVTLRLSCIFVVNPAAPETII
jgi:hypothetical protein